LKKKPKKKSSNKKKEALADVKEALRNYDMSVAEAKSKNITLPAELGVLPVNIEDVNSVKELNELAIKLKSMTAQINALIAQGASQSRTIGLFQERPQGQSILPTIVQPRILPQQQIPSERPIDIRPIQPIVPSQKPIDPSQIPDDNAEKTLDQIRQEILDKLSPEDKAKAEEELEKQRQQPAPASPDIPDEPDIPDQTPPLPNIKPPEQKINPSDLETNLNIEFGTKTIPKLVSPIGFYDIFTNYRRYVKDLIFRTKKIIEGQYRISKADETILENERNRILNSYDSWLKSLNKPQVQYLDNDPQLQSVNNEMLKELNLDVEELAQNILRQQGVKLTNFEVGDTPVPIEQKAEEKLSPQGQNFKVQLEQIRNIIENDLEKSKKTVKPDELNEIINDLNLVKVNIDNYNKLQPIDKVGLEVLYGQVVDEYNKAQEEVEDKLLEVQKGLPFEPPRPKQKPKKGKTQLDKDIELLNNYVDNISINFSKKIMNALKRIPNSQITIEGINAIRSRTFDLQTKGKDTKKIVKDFLEKENLLQTKIEMKPSSVDI
jgi:hypothetical protein